MTIEIKTNSVEPIRQTYGHIARRFGDKPATRYQEASYDLEAKTNFHYRPPWEPTSSTTSGVPRFAWKTGMQ